MIVIVATILLASADKSLPVYIILPGAFLVPLAIIFIGSFLIPPKGGGH
jgi:hypothetical protein